jgi:hypothetical protein
MSFLIGVILIIEFDLAWWWYLLAAGWYTMEWQKHWEYYRSLHREIHELRGQLESLKPPIDHDYD